MGWEPLPGHVSLEVDELSALLYFAQDESGRVELRGYEVVSDGPIDSIEAVRRLPIREHVAYLNSAKGTKPERAIAILRGGGEVRIVFDRAPRLRIPGTHAQTKPAGFYERFADVYRALTATGERGPAERIAAANDVPVTTVHRWVREARSRGLIPPGRPGRAG